jgi:hypothetical protein
MGPSLSRPMSRGFRDQGFRGRIKLGIFLEVEESGGWRTSPAAKYSAPLQRWAEDKTGATPIFFSAKA